MSSAFNRTCLLIPLALATSAAWAGPEIRTEPYQLARDMSVSGLLRKSGHTSLVKKLFGERVPAVRVAVQDLTASLQRTLRTGSAPEARKIVIELFPARKGLPVALNLQDMSFLVEHAELRIGTALARLRDLAALLARTDSSKSLRPEQRENLIELARHEEEAYLTAAEHLGRYVVFFRAIQSHLDWLRRDTTVSTALAKQNADYLLATIGIKDWRLIDLLRQEDADYQRGLARIGQPPPLPDSAALAVDSYQKVAEDYLPAQALARLGAYRAQGPVIEFEQDHERAMQYRHAAKRLLTAAPIEQIFRWVSQHDTPISGLLKRAKLPDFTQVFDKLSRFQETLDWNDQYGYELLEVGYNWATLSGVDQVKELVRLGAKGNEEDQKNHVVFKYLARRLDLRDLWIRVRDAVLAPENAQTFDTALIEEIGRLEASRRKGELLGIDPQNRPGFVRVLKDYLVMVLSLYLAAPMVTSLTHHATALGEVGCEKLRASLADGGPELPLDQALACQGSAVTPDLKRSARSFNDSLERVSHDDAEE